MFVALVYENVTFTGKGYTCFEAKDNIYILEEVSVYKKGYFTDCFVVSPLI
jgi:hypothetical protein